MPAIQDGGLSLCSAIGFPEHEKGRLPYFSTLTRCSAIDGKLPANLLAKIASFRLRSFLRLHAIGGLVRVYCHSVVRKGDRVNNF
jgi:hypothetical protein